MGYRSDVGYLVVFGVCKTPQEIAKRKVDDEEWSKELERKGSDARAINMGEKWEICYPVWQKVFKTFLADAKSRPEFRLIFEDEVENESVEIDEERLFIKFSAESVKWYDGYDDVTCHIKFIDFVEQYTYDLEQSDDMNSIISWAFVRIGEDSDDIDSRTGGETYIASDYIYPVRSIHWGI